MVLSLEMPLVAFTAILIIGYHVNLYKTVWLDPLKTAIGSKNHMRQLWVKSMISGKRDILAVQTLRNQVMAATFLASTSILICLGSFGAAFRPGIFGEIAHTLNLAGTRSEALWMLKLMVLGILFFITFFNFTLSIRYFNHVGFMINSFEEKDVAVSVTAVADVINHGALHYTIGMRGFYLSIPLALWLFGPTWMVIGSLILIAVLYRLDRET